MIKQYTQFLIWKRYKYDHRLKLIFVDGLMVFTSLWLTDSCWAHVAGSLSRLHLNWQKWSSWFSGKSAGMRWLFFDCVCGHWKQVGRWREELWSLLCALALRCAPLFEKMKRRHHWFFCVCWIRRVWSFDRMRACQSSLLPQISSS